MYRKKCGKQIAEDSKFCQSCGKPQDASNPPAAQDGYSDVANSKHT